MLAGKRHLTAADEALARADGQLDAAQLLVERIIGLADGAPIPDPLAARSARDAALAGQLIADAVTGLVRASGTSGVGGASPLPRFWRDVTCGATHAALRFELNAPDYAQVLLNAAGADR